MTESLNPERKRLLYRALHRGFKEADIVVGRFAEAALPTMTEEEVAEFAALLEVPDQTLYAWIIGREDVPPNHQGPVLDRMRPFEGAPKR